MMNEKDATIILQEVKKFLKKFFEGDERMAHFADSVPVEAIQNMPSVPQSDGSNLYCLNLFAFTLNIFAKVGEKTEVSGINLIQ